PSAGQKTRYSPNVLFSDAALSGTLSSSGKSGDRYHEFAVFGSRFLNPPMNTSPQGWQYNNSSTRAPQNSQRGRGSEYSRPTGGDSLPVGSACLPLHCGFTQAQSRPA